LGALIQNCDIVVSLVPAQFHVPIANMCLKYNKHLITSSYISPEMRELDD